MEFTVERIDLTDIAGALDWNRTAHLQLSGEAHGNDACGALAAVVAGDGGVQLGITAAYADGQAVMVAQKGDVIYALRAIPRAIPRPCSA
jgi:hypothetical protein